MNKITQTMRFRQSLVEYSFKNGVTAAAIKYRTNRQYVYRWRGRYDGTLQSLADLSHRPHYHPNQHKESELKLIRDMLRRNQHTGLVVFWVKLRQRGYNRSITGLYRVLKRLGALRVRPPNPKYISKPYEQMTYPGQRIQIDVKHVPVACLVGETAGQKFYQYTAIDEYSRFRYLEAFDECSTYTSAVFLANAHQFFLKNGFNIETVQTDNGTEFTNRFIPKSKDRPTLFQTVAAHYGITHKLIRPYTPRHNGKVERSIRKDNEYFYATHRFYSLHDLEKQLAVHCRQYNNFPMRPLGWLSPRKTLANFFANNVTHH